MIGIHGEDVKAHKTIDLDGTWVNKHGVEYQHAIIADIVLNPDQNVNLFSIPSP